jgi:hypothetical protein
MTTASIIFDRLAYIDKLRSSGIDDPQARAHADALDYALRDSVATRGDIDTVLTEIRLVESKIDVSAASLKVDILRWLVVTQVALAGFIFAAFKFLH